MNEVHKMAFFKVYRFRNRSSKLCVILLVCFQILFDLTVFMTCLRSCAVSNDVESVNRANIAFSVAPLNRKLGLNLTTKAQKEVPPTTRKPHTTAKKTTKKTEIDMVNDYQPWVDFKFVYPEVQPVIEGPRDFYLIVVVNSGAKGNEFRQRRAKIRETWASRKTCEYTNAMNDARVKDLKWILVFVLGKAGKDEDEQNIEEAKKYNDMIIGDISDNYLNSIFKLYMGQLWASLFGAKYTLKTDDDVYVRIPKVIEYLVSEGSPSRFYGGATYHGTSLIVSRWPGGKWSISKKYFPEDVFPPFNAGAFFLLSADLLGGLMNYVYIRKPFHTDNAYIGVAIRYLKVKVVHILSFVIENNMGKLVRTKDDCYILKVFAYGHGVRGEDMEHVNKRLENLCHGNVTRQALKCQV